MAEGISALPPLELMERVLSVLPEQSRERAALSKVIAGLSIPDTFAAINGHVVHQTHNTEVARKLLSEILPVLKTNYGSNPYVAELLTRYLPDGRPRRDA